MGRVARNRPSPRGGGLNASTAPLLLSFTDNAPFRDKAVAMFAKKKDSAPAPAFTPLAIEPAAPAPAPTPAAPPPRPKPASMLAQGVAIKGDVMGDGEVHLDCVLQGDIRVGKLVLGPNARVEGAARPGHRDPRPGDRLGLGQAGAPLWDGRGRWRHHPRAAGHGKRRPVPGPQPEVPASGPDRLGSGLCAAPAAGHAPAMAVYPG